MKINKHIPFLLFAALSFGIGLAGQEEDKQLLTAAREGDVQAARMALKDGAAVNATMKKSRYISKEELEHDKKSDDRKTKWAAESENLSALHYAAYWGNLELVRLLTKQDKVDINLRAYLDRTPLYYAAEHDYLEVVRHLVSQHADLGKDGEYTPLHAAARSRNVEIVKFLVGKNPNAIYARDYLLGFTPLASMVWSSSPRYSSDTEQRKLIEIAEFLIDAADSATIDINLLSDLPENPEVSDQYQSMDYLSQALFGAVERDNTTAARLLVRRGANPSATDKSGRSVIQEARNHGSFEMQASLQPKRFIIAAGLSIATIVSLIILFKQAKKRGYLPNFLRQYMDDGMINNKVEELRALRDDKPAFDAAVAKLRREQKKQYVDEILERLEARPFATISSNEEITPSFARPTAGGAG